MQPTKYYTACVHIVTSEQILTALVFWLAFYSFTVSFNPLYLHKLQHLYLLLPYN